MNTPITSNASPGPAVTSPALIWAVRLARSAHLKLGLALSMQCAWLAGGRSRTTTKVHSLLSLPRAKLVQRFLRVASRPRSNASEWHPPWEVLAGQVVALDQQYQDLVGRLGSTTSPVNCYELIQWTLAAGGLAHDLVTGSADSHEFQQLYAESAQELRVCYILHLV